MEEKNLLKIAILSSLIGIIILAYISNTSNLNYNDISSINNDYLDKTVKIKGTLTNFVSTPKAKIMDIEDSTGKITAVTFNEQELSIKENDLLEITGKVSLYQGSFEIIADTITKFE